MGAIEDRIKNALFAEQSPTAGVENQPEQDAVEETPEGDTESKAETYRVKVDGEERDVTLDELLKGYMMESDYRKKTSHVSEQRKAIEAKQAELDKTLAEAKEIIEFELADLESDEMKALREDDPQEYWKRVDKVKAKAERYNEKRRKQTAELEAKRQEIIEKERENLMQKVPDWLDTDKMKTEVQSIGQMLTDLGFTQDEAANVTDHRIWAMARKAMLFDQMSKTDVSAKKVKQAPKSASPSASQKVQATDDARTRLRKTGKPADAAKAIKNLLYGG